MEDSSFDRLARSFAGPSRRSLITRAAGLAAGAIVVAATGENATAASLRANGEICRKSGECKSANCGLPDASGRQRCIACQYALAADPKGNPIFVDDTITVYLNGQPIYTNGDTASYVDRFSFGAAKKGDSIRITATNSPYHCGLEGLYPLYLICVGGTGSQTLDPIGSPMDGNGHGCGETFYDRTFTIAI